MERSLRSQKQQTEALQTELSNVRRRLGELEHLYGKQRTAGAEAELQANELNRRLAALERDLREAREDKVLSLNQQSLSEIIRIFYLVKGGAAAGFSERHATPS